MTYSGRNYRLLLGSQVLAAFADNATLAVILGQLTFLKEAGKLSESQLGAWNAVYTSLFFFPYVLLAPIAGFLNDRYPKTTWLVGGNAIKILGTMTAASSIWCGHVWQGAGYLLVGIGGCIFSPAKYGILPEIVERERLVKANGLLELLTVTAILAGFVGGAMMIDTMPVLLCYALILAIFGASLFLNTQMTKTAAHPQVRFGRSVDEFFGNLGDLLLNPRLFRILCGTGLFWFSAAVVKMNFQPWGLNFVHFLEGAETPTHINTRISLYGVWLTTGMVLGAFLAGRLHRVGDLRFTRFYGWTLAAFIQALGAAELIYGAGYIHGQVPVVLLLVAAGTAAGCFLIPLNAALQSESSPARLGKTIAAQNFVDNLAMLLAGTLVFVANRAMVRPSGIFVLLAALVGIVTTVLKFPRPTDENVTHEVTPEI